jgi:hypothetical protein
MRNHILSYFLLALIAVAAGLGLSACGGGGSSGSAAPASAGIPVAVEIPSLDAVSDLPFTSAIVVSATSSISAPTKSAWGLVSKALGTSGVDFSSKNPINSCYFYNSAIIALQASLRVDESLCSAQDAIANITNPYNGEYHIFSSSSTESNSPNRYRFKITRDSNNIITKYVMQTCFNTTELSSVIYTIDGSKFTAATKDIRTTAPQREVIAMNGTLSTSDPTRFTVKQMEFDYTGNRSSSGDFVGEISMTQGTNYVYLDSYDSVGGAPRVLGQSDLTNPTSTPFDPREYSWGAGAAKVIYDGTLTTACWDNSILEITCSGSNYDAISGKTNRAVSTPSISTFSGEESWDCSGTSEYTLSFSMSNTSCFRRFSIDTDYIDCIAEVKGSVTVTPSVSGTTLSTNSNSPTSVGTSPSILLTGSQALDTSSTNSSTVTLVNTSTNGSVSLTYTNWDSTGKILTLSPSLTSGQTYKLTLVGSSTVATTGTVIRAPGATPPADQLQSTGTYYMTAQ